MICWHDGPIETLARTGGPVAWSIAADGPAARAVLARTLIARLADVPVEQVQLARRVNGAPWVANPPGWFFGLSGRDGDCLIATARMPIAVDREPVDDAPPLPDMMTVTETRLLERLPIADRPLDWLRRWTIKEAHAKLIGDPLRIRPETIETCLASADEATATFEGVSRCWTRRTATALETVAIWA